MGADGSRLPAQRRSCSHLVLLAALASALVSGCCFSHQLVRVGDTEEGEASYYAPALEGHPTANGEHYQGEAMTCAHRTLPFGTQLEVTELNGGRSVVVRVNDRGPYADGRVVDLSMRAASQLGLVRRGRGKVRLRVVRVGVGSPHN